MGEILKGQVAVVTGGNAGIGKAIAQKFAEQGAIVAILGTNAERGQQAITEIQKAVPQAIVKFYQTDVSKTAQVETAIKELTASLGSIDILVNNAGITRDQLLLKMSEEDWDNVMAVNAKSCYNTARAVVRSMLKARKGVIINMSSVVGITGNAGQTNYAASKAAIIGFTKALAKELASRHIRVNCICPGFIETAMTDVLTDTQETVILSQIPLGRMGRAEEVAHLALFLASDHASYITGQTLNVDGGMVM